MDDLGKRSKKPRPPGKECQVTSGSVKESRSPAGEMPSGQGTRHGLGYELLSSPRAEGQVGGPLPMQPAVVVFPYLSLEERLRVGPWELIPKGDLKPEDADSESALSLARAHLAVYDLPEGDEAKRCGCFARRGDGLVGGAVEPESLGSLRLSVLAALLIMNPEAEDRSNPGMVVSTSDNAAMHGHPLNAEGRLAVEYGAMMRTLVGGIKVKENPGFIGAPVELHLPWLGSQIDGEFADALHSVLVRGTDDARRLATAIEWLDVAWRNTTFITTDVRVMALKSGFEVLLNVGERVEDGRRELSLLLDQPGAPRMKHSYVSLAGNPSMTPPITDLEWWFTRFAFLRNDIAHGTEVAPGDWHYEGGSHVMIAQRHLLEAIRKKVADATGNQDLLVSPPVERGIRRRIRQYASERGDPTG